MILFEMVRLFLLGRISNPITLNISICNAATILVHILSHLWSYNNIYQSALPTVIACKAYCCHSLFCYALQMLIFDAVGF